MVTYTLLLITTASATNTTLFELNYNFLNDIVPIAGIFRVPNVMVVPPSVPAKTVPEFIAYAKANPGKVSMASPGTGTPPHLFGALFKAMAGVDMVHVPYRGIETVQVSPAKSSGVGQPLEDAENLSIFVQCAPDGSSPVHATLPQHQG